MSYVLTLTNSSGSISIDFTSMNPSLVVSLNNPIITIPTPTEASTLDDPKFNVYTVNIGMLATTILITLKESSGFGQLPIPSTPSTVREMLHHFTYDDHDPKYLYINSAVPNPVQINSYRASVSPGHKDIVEHNLSLVLTTKKPGE